jgi:hypothetical protein
LKVEDLRESRLVVCDPAPIPLDGKAARIEVKQGRRDSVPPNPTDRIGAHARACRWPVPVELRDAHRTPSLISLP